MQKYLDIYFDTNKKLRALQHAMSTIHWDSNTEAPRGCFAQRGKNSAVLSELIYKLSTDSVYLDAINNLYEQREKLDPVMRHEIEKQKCEVDKTSKIPMEEYIKFTELLENARQAYFDAKAKSDYNMFKPYLEQIIAYNRNYTVWQQTDKLSGYDVLLDEYEKGFTQKDFDSFFNVLREKLVPFVKKVTSKKLKFNDSWLNAYFPADKQKEFSQYLESVMCFDLNRGLMKESEHPFTLSIDSTNVRFTTHFYENMVASAIFSTIHELGHATYEQQVDPALNDTMSGGGVSMGMHESQSRFYENIVGRSYEFWQRHYPKLVETFPNELKGVTIDDFYKGINLAECSLIRTEADELTYALHIMIRYEIEKRMISGEIGVDELPKEWNKLYKEYLGVEVPNDKMGILQDVHWAGGTIGYFPTYAVGSAYASQIYHKMSQDIDTKKEMGSENLKQINLWLKDKIHKYGSTMDPKDILKSATGEAFNPNYYVDYLINKYGKIYDIK